MAAECGCGGPRVLDAERLRFDGSSGRVFMWLAGGDPVFEGSVESAVRFRRHDGRWAVTLVLAEDLEEVC